MSKNSLETSDINIETLRDLLITGCKDLGLRENTCVALTLLLSSKLSLQAMVVWLLEEEDNGIRPTKEEVIEMALKIKEYEKKLKNNSI